MAPTSFSACPAGTTRDAPSEPSLAHRWFVEHNPLYLLSAALVLAGCILLSCGLAQAHEDPVATSLGVALVSEVYAVSLLGGAALLTRLGKRRPAVMLALLFTLYQWDLTLHTETCAYLRGVGPWAAAAWVAVFAAKLYGIAWALRIRLSRRVAAAAMLGAIGLALGPELLSSRAPAAAGGAVSVWIFALGALARRADGLTSLTELTPWGQTVLRRCARVGWILSGVLLGVHVLDWSANHDFARSAALPVLPLLLVRGVRSEWKAYAVVAATLSSVLLVMPADVPFAALLAGAALILRALSPSFSAPAAAAVASAVPEPPYRSSGQRAPEPPSAAPALFATMLDRAARARAYSWALLSVYVSLYASAVAPDCSLPGKYVDLDTLLPLCLLVPLAVCLLVTARAMRSRSPFVPLACACAHVLAAEHLVPVPDTAIGWGIGAIGVGFGLLGGSLAATWRIARPRSSTPDRHAPLNAPSYSPRE